MEYLRPYLYPKQFEAFYTPVRYICCEATTKAGKTHGAISWLVEKAFVEGGPGKNYWWVAPVSSQSEIAYRRIKLSLTQGTFTSRDSPTPVITLINGAMIWFKSGDNPDSLFGEDVFAAVVDEASRCKEESWHALRSTLTATQGPIRMIGNVKGRKNWFYQLARIAESKEHADMHYVKMTVLDARDAGLVPDSEIVAAKRDLPEHVFQELYMAIPADDGGNPFGLNHIQFCTKPPVEDRSSVVAFGIDLAKKQDWTVVIGLDTEGRVRMFRRWQQVPWRETVRRIHAIVGEDTPALVDSTGVGDPVLEELQVGHGNFTGYHFSSVSKQKIMEGLAVSIQSHEMEFPKGQITVELEAFEFVYTRTGVRYAVPEESLVKYDDCVCALALAREQYTTVAPGANMIGYMQIASETAVEQANVGLGEDFARTLLQEQNRELMPWRSGPSATEQLDNELDELYETTLSAHPLMNRKRFCSGCGQELKDNTRVSDGVYVWHMGCARLGLNIRAN